MLCLSTAVGYPTLLEGADDLGEEMAQFALVQPGVAAPVPLRASQPVEQRALDPSQFLKRQVELDLPAVSRELLQHDGRGHGTCLQRRDQTDRLVPVFANDIGLGPLASCGCRSV